MDEYLQHQGGELRLHSSGPMPPGAGEHLASLINSALPPRTKKLRKRPDGKIVRRQGLEDIAEPAILSAFALADDDLNALDARFAARERQLQQQPVPPANTAGEEAHLAALSGQIQDVVRAAAAEGVRFTARIAEPALNSVVSNVGTAVDAG